MFRILILFSRYAFIAGIILFLWQSIKCFAGKNRETESGRFILVQRIILTAINMLGFFILQLGGFSGRVPAIIIGIAMNFYIVAFSLVTDRMYKKRTSVMSNCVLMLMVTGLLLLQRLDNSLALKQLVWFAAGLIILSVMPIAVKVLPKLYKFKYLYIIIALALTVFTFIAGEEVYGSKNWISIGSFGFQPSEISKILLILYLASVFKKRTGEGLHYAITCEKLNKAKEMLLYTDISIEEIADETGFSSRSHFCTSFKEHMGISPKQYRIKNKDYTFIV